MSILHLEGAYENELATSGEFNPQAPKTALMLPSGQRIVLPTEVLLEAMSARTTTADESADESTTQHAVDKAEGLAAPSGPSTPSTPSGLSGSSGPGEVAVIPLVEEQMQVTKQEVERSRLRVHRETQEEVQTVSLPLTDVRWEVEHVAVGQRVEQYPEIREVGETVIFPLVEERMVVTRELWLREEVHVRKVKTVVEKTAEFPVKRDVLIEERLEKEATQAAPSGAL